MINGLKIPRKKPHIKNFGKNKINILPTLYINRK